MGQENGPTDRAKGRTGGMRSTRSGSTYRGDGNRDRAKRPGGEKPDSRSPAPSNGRGSSPDRSAPRGPALPEGVDATSVDPSVWNELRTLPEELRTKVAEHLVAAELLLAEEDVEVAKRHVREAKRLAGRVACVREAAGIVAYRAGEYADALAELRAARRMAGDDSLVPMMADCERGLGRPERALTLVRDMSRADEWTRIEALIVESGARRDLGQGEAAVLLLEGPISKRMDNESLRARLEYAYASALEGAGRIPEARTWFLTSVATDPQALSDAVERAELLGQK